MVGLWVAYLVPTVLRRRQHMVDTRTEDRFSKDLRIVAVCDQEWPEPGNTDAGTSTGAILSPPLGMTTRPPSALARGAGPMATNDRPALTAERLATLDNRRAAARRRGRLCLGLVLATATLVATSLITTLSWAFALIPAVLLVAVLILGRKTVVAQNRTDQALAQRQRISQYGSRSASPAEEQLAQGLAAQGPNTAHPRPRSARPVQPRSASSANARPAAEDLNTSVITPAESTYLAKKHATGRPVAPANPIGVQAPAQPRAQTPPVPAAPAPHERAAAQQYHELPRELEVQAAAPRWEPPSITTELRKLTAAHMAEIASGSAARENEAADPDIREAKADMPDTLGVNLNSILARRRVK